ERLDKKKVNRDNRDMYMRQAGGGIGHYHVPLNYPHVVSLDPAANNGVPSVNTSSPTPVPSTNIATETPGPTLEQLISEAVAAGTAEVDDGENHADDEHRDEMEAEEDGEEDGEGIIHDDDDLGAKDGEDGVQDVEDEEGYGAY
ncbi:hypothetical protein DXG01_003557, partial [Tephrocybe rancida]